MPRSGSAALVIALLLVVSCDDPVEPPRVHHTSCDDAPGVTHSGSIGNAVWRAADGPHRFTGTVTFDTLEIRAGTLVCGEPGAVLVGAKLTAIGTADAPIVFTAADPVAPWGGMRLLNQPHFSEEEASEFRHAVIRDLAEGIDASDLIMRNSRVVEACQDGDCVAIRGIGYSGIRLEDVVIDSSGGDGVGSGWRAGISLTRVRILNSAGIGLISSASDVHLEAEGLRIVGGGSYPARIGAWQLQHLAGTREGADSLLGNASDTLLISGGGETTEAPMRVYRQLPWRLTRSFLDGSPSILAVPDLTIEAGASISFAEPHVVLLVRKLSAIGTAEEPVVLEGGAVAWGHLGDADENASGGADPAPATIRLAHLFLKDMVLGQRLRWPPASVTLEMDSIAANASFLDLGRGTSLIRTAALTNSRIRVRQSGAVLEDVTMAFPGDDLASSGASALHIDSGSVSLTGCDIRDAPFDAILVSESVAEGTFITGCNLVNNAGFGVNNLSAFTVDAAGNWWGDPAGPDGPDGDGVSGDVVVEPVRTEPVQR